MRRTNITRALFAATAIFTISCEATAQVTFAQPFNPMHALSRNRVTPTGYAHYRAMQAANNGFIQSNVVVQTANGPQVVTVNTPISTPGGTITRSFIPSPPPGAQVGQNFWFDTPVVTPGGTITRSFIPSPPPGAQVGQNFWFGGTSRPMPAPAPQPRPR